MKHFAKTPNLTNRQAVHGHLFETVNNVLAATDDIPDNLFDYTAVVARVLEEGYDAGLYDRMVELPADSTLRKHLYALRRRTGRIGRISLTDK